MLFKFTIYNQNIFLLASANFPDGSCRQSAGVSPCFTGCLISPCHFISAGVYTACLISYVPTGLPTSNLLLHTSYLLPKNILPLPHRSLAVLDGVHRTMVIAAHAHRAVAVPFRATVFEGDVLQRARFHALAAMDASLADTIFAVVGGRAVETRIHQISLDPSQTAHDYFGKTILINETRNVSL